MLGVIVNRNHHIISSFPCKTLASAIDENIGAYPSYQAAPSFAYIVGNYTLDRNGVLTGPRNSQQLLAMDRMDTAPIKIDNHDPGAIPGVVVIVVRPAYVPMIYANILIDITKRSTVTPSARRLVLLTTFQMSLQNAYHSGGNLEGYKGGVAIELHRGILLAVNSVHDRWPKRPANPNKEPRRNGIIAVVSLKVNIGYVCSFRFRQRTTCFGEYVLCK